MVPLTDLTPSSDVTELLAQLSASSPLPDRVQKSAARLLHRLTSPVQIGICGPRGDDIAKKLLDGSNDAPEDLAFKRVSATDYADIDIALWCTSTFDDTEFAQWNQAPDVLKDHSFLVGLQGLELDPSWTDIMQDVAAEWFHSFVAVEVQNGDLGLEELRGLITNRVNAGRRADLDHATLFVERHKAHLVSKPAQAPLRQVLAAADHERSEQSGQSDTLQSALRYLEETAKTLSGVATDDEADASRDVLSVCAETAENLVEVMIDAEFSNADHRSLGEDILTAADEVVLMSMEENLSSAVDAVTVLLQIRKDLSQRIAA